MSNSQSAPKPARPPRVESIDAFRGFTILGMILVIQVSGYRHLPLTFPHWGSAPVSTFKHAGEDGEPEEWAFWEGTGENPSTIYRQAEVMERLDNGRYKVALKDDKDRTVQVYEDAKIRHAVPLKAGAKIIAVFDKKDMAAAPKFQGIGNGCTFTDWVAPFFVFIVGMCIPLSRGRRGGEWWRHVGSRTILLILAGVIYISLILKLSYWWGILQAIGIAYFMGAASMFLPPMARWGAVAVLGAIHAFMSWHFPWWTSIGDPAKGFLTILNPTGDALRPLTVHCTPWGSISYGLTTIIGTLLGEAIVTRDRIKITRQSLLVGAIGCVAGLLLHYFQAPMNKDVVSVSYSIFTAGLGAFCFLAFYYLMDVWGYKAWAWPLTVFGANALLAYFMQPVVRIFLTACGLHAFFTSKPPDLGLPMALFAKVGWTAMFWGLLWTFILWLVTLFCNKRNIYWKL